MVHVTRDGRFAKFLEYRGGGRLAVFLIDGKPAIRLRDGSFRWDGKHSLNDVLTFQQTIHGTFKI